jgi:hypothetical protein
MASPSFPSVLFSRIAHPAGNRGRKSRFGEEAAEVLTGRKAANIISRVEKTDCFHSFEDADDDVVSIPLPNRR